MINIIESESQILIQGHAGYGPAGQDIVCASISTLFQCLANSIETLTEDEIQVQIEAGNSFIRYGDLSDNAQLFVRSFFLSCEWVAADFPDYVRVTRRECH